MQAASHTLQCAATHTTTKVVAGACARVVGMLVHTRRNDMQISTVHATGTGGAHTSICRAQTAQLHSTLLVTAHACRYGGGVARTYELCSSRRPQILPWPMRHGMYLHVGHNNYLGKLNLKGTNPNDNEGSRTNYVYYRQLHCSIERIYSW